MAALKVNSRTASLGDAFRTHSTGIQHYIEKLPYPDGAIGVIAAIDGGIICADLSDSDTTLLKLWDRLVSSCAMDAIQVPYG